MIACGATMSTDFAIYLCIISVNYVNRLLRPKKVFVSDYITRKTGVGRSGKHFFAFFLF